MQEGYVNRHILDCGVYGESLRRVDEVWVQQHKGVGYNTSKCVAAIKTKKTYDIDVYACVSLCKHAAVDLVP